MTKRMLPFILLLGLAMAGSAPASPPSTDVDALSRSISSFRLDNGLWVVVASRPELMLAAVNLSIAVGAVDDPPAVSGMTHLLEHVSLNGTSRLGSLDQQCETNALDLLDKLHASRRAESGPGGGDHETLSALDRRIADTTAQAQACAESGDVYAARLERHGAVGLNATTSADATQYFGRLPARHIETWMEMEADRLSDPLFRHFYRERQAVAQEIQNLTGPAARAGQILLDELFPRQPAARPIFGRLKEVVQIRRPDALRFWRDHYRPDLAAIAVVGQVGVERVREMARRHMQAWAPLADGPQERTQKPPLPPPVLRLAAAPEGTWALFGFPVLGLPDRDWAGLEVWREFVNSPELSPLLEQAAARGSGILHLSAHSGYRSQRAPSLFLVRVLGARHMPEGIFLRRLREAWAELPQAQDGDLRGAILITQRKLLRQLAEPDSLAAALAFHQSVHGDWKRVFRRLAALQALTPADLREIAGRHLRLDRDTRRDGEREGGL